MGDVQTGEDGQFHISGATREQTEIEVMLKIYHDCLDGEEVCFWEILRFLEICETFLIFGYFCEFAENPKFLRNLKPIFVF
jgi:hypothetical protein